METSKLKELIFLLPRDDNGTLWPFTISEGVHKLKDNYKIGFRSLNKYKSNSFYYISDFAIALTSWHKSKDDDGCIGYYGCYERLTPSEAEALNEPYVSLCKIEGVGLNLDNYIVVEHNTGNLSVRAKTFLQRIGSFTHQLFNKRGYKYTDSNITEDEQTYYGTPTYLRRVDVRVVLKLLEEATKIDFAD